MNIKKTREYISHLLNWTTIDRVVVFGVMTKLWGFLAGPVTMVVIASYFDPVTQGYYYTFASVLALQVFVEMGLGRVIIQFASHEWADLVLTKAGLVEGDRHSLSRLSSLMRSSFLWYFVAGCFVFLGIGIGGFFFFSQNADPAIIWILPWFVLCLFAGINLWFTPIWSVLEGCNQLRQVYFFRFTNGILGSISIWLAIALGAGLWTAAIASAVRIAWQLLYLFYRYRLFVRQLFMSAGRSTIDWLTEIWPMQWRIALSWISGYFCFSLFTPVLFHYHGAVIAGQMD